MKYLAKLEFENSFQIEKGSTLSIVTSIVSGYALKLKGYANKFDLDSLKELSEFQDLLNIFFDDLKSQMEQKQ